MQVTDPNTGLVTTEAPSCGMTVANMVSYAISSSMILVIHDNMINGTNHIVYHVLVDISRCH
jgi:hypothetical protein